MLVHINILFIPLITHIVLEFRLCSTQNLSVFIQNYADNVNFLLNMCLEYANYVSWSTVV